MVFLTQDFMRREVLTLSPDASAFEALRLCHERRIRHIPIVDDGKVVGIISDRDLRDASPPLGDPERVSHMKAMQVSEVMTRKVTTAGPRDTIVRAAREMHERKIESLPVVDEEELVGIITSSDVMRALVALSGASEPGHSRIAVQARKPGVLADAASIIRDQGVDVFSILSSPHKRSVYDRTLIFQVAAKDPSWIIQNLRTAEYEASRWPARS